MRFSQSFLIASLLLSTGCASYRNTSLDSRLPDFESPELTLKNLKSPQTRDGQNPNVAFAVALSGGGHRAANLSAGVLLGLESITVPGADRNTLDEIDYFSTVSGGGFAAGTYIAAKYDHMHKNTPGRFSFHNALCADKQRRLKDLRRDYQNSVLTQWIHWKCLGYMDGGDLMEDKLDRHILGSKYRKGKRSILLGDIFRPAGSSEAVILPYWIANATVYENGARFMFTPEYVNGYNIDRFVHNMKYQHIYGDPLSLPASAGMRASASFPVLFPAATFKCEPENDQLNSYLHLLDGGLTDNLGVRSALELLTRDPAKKKLLIVVDAYARSGHPYSSHQSSPSGAGVAYRIMNIGLDSEHASLRQDTEREAGKNNITALILGLDQLKPKISEKMLDLKTEIAEMRKKQREAIGRRFRREITRSLRAKEDELAATENETEALYQDATAVATSLKITRGEQAVLLKAGMTLIERHRDKIIRLFEQ